MDGTKANGSYLELKQGCESWGFHSHESEDYGWVHIQKLHGITSHLNYRKIQGKTTEADNYNMKQF